MSEWLKEHAWKACVGETLPWVRIPLSPPSFAPDRRRRMPSEAAKPRRRACPVLQLRPNFYMIAGAASNIGVQIGPETGKARPWPPARRAQGYSSGDDVPMSRLQE